MQDLPDASDKVDKIRLDLTGSLSACRHPGSWLAAIVAAWKDFFFFSGSYIGNNSNNDAGEGFCLQL